MRRNNNRLSSILFVSCVCVAVTLILLFPKQTTMPASSQQQGPGRRSFPVGFLFGTASASYQYEGAANEGGRGPSIWDTFAHTPGKIQDGSNGDVAADEYHRYKEDIQLVKNMGMDAYRFSVSWSRILPKGTVEGGINKVGIEYYNNLINELLKNGIKPFITLFHWDLPQALEDKYGGFRSKEIVNDFRAFAAICFKEFGDRVKNWITLNEPWSFACISYDYGTMAPGRCSKFVRNCTAGDSAREPYIVAHNLLLAHASAVEYYRSHFQATQKGSIGISLNCHWMMPFSKHSDHQDAAQRAIDFMFGWFMDPIAKGEYPSSMRLLAGDRLPHFTEKEASILRGSFDFLGINYYTSRYVLHVPEKPDPAWTSYTQDSQTTLTTEKNGVKLGRTGASDWLYVYPNGLKELLLYTKRQYNNPAVYITENGIDEFNNESIPLQDALNDRWRIEYYELHLEAVNQAVKDGANVRGYFAWSLLDNFEWHMGYTLRFGLHFVDFKNGLARYPKASAHWFSYFLSGASN